MSAGIDEILIAAAAEYALGVGLKTAVNHREQSLSFIDRVARKVFRRPHHDAGFVEVKRRVGLWYWYHID